LGGLVVAAEINVGDERSDRDLGVSTFAW